MTTTADILKLAEEYADAECQATRRSHVDPSIEHDALRTAVESLVAERDALKADAAGERGVFGRWIIESLPTLATLMNEDSEDGGEYLRMFIDRGQRLADAALRGQP